jgi:hypothetical protein
MMNAGNAQVFYVDFNGVVTCGNLVVNGQGTTPTTIPYLNVINELRMGGTLVANNAIWTGYGVQSNHPVYASEFAIYGLNPTVGTIAAPVTFTTTDGKTVKVVGSIIVSVV